jgi:6-phosphogluconate dehydrogenase
MRLGMVGLGRMGGNMTIRLVRAGHEVVGYGRREESRQTVAAEGAETAASLEELVEKLAPPRTVWSMVPSGTPTETTIASLTDLLANGDLVIDGGNSNFKESIRRGKLLREQGVGFLDIGVSGGIWGLKEGYCMMAGGDAGDIDRVRPVLDALAPPDGWAHVGRSGAGHYVKMVHNGIEYGLLQAYGEGFEILEKAELELDLGQIAEVWRRGSVVRSWLLDLLALALEREPDLGSVDDYVEDSGEGRWTVLEAIERDVPAYTITHSLMARFASRQQESFSAKVIAALRREFGGHAVREESG